jgi:hypothetical protein
MRISRPCYDKGHRCPGWAGGGWRYPRGEDRCQGGHIRGWYEYRPLRWRFLACDTCDVIVWPYVTRWLDPSWVRWWITDKLRDLRYWWQDRQGRRS